MAKPNKSGLGRGLGSLLGTTYEEEVVEEKPSTRERILVEMDEIPAYDPILEPSTSRRPIIPTKSEEKPEEAPLIPPLMYASETEAVTEPTEDNDPKSVDEVDINLIVPNPNQPRTNFKKEDLEELARSIEANGLLQPILVRDTGDGTYQIIAGERRWQAAKQAGITEVPIRIREVDDSKAIELALIENIQRSDLNPIEEAYGYKRLIERNKMTVLEIASAMSKGRSTITNTLRLLDLPEEAQQLLYEEKITAGHARAILAVPDDEKKKKLTQKIVDEGISVREAENLARLYSGKIPSKGKSSTAIPSSYKKVAKALKDALGTNVKVKRTNGKNRLEIEFKDEEDLARLFDELLGSN